MKGFFNLFSIFLNNNALYKADQLSETEYIVTILFDEKRFF